MPLGKHASKQQIFLNSTLKKNSYSDTKRATQKAYSKIPCFTTNTGFPYIKCTGLHITARMWNAYPLLRMETGLALLHPLFCPPCWKPSSDFWSAYDCWTHTHRCDHSQESCKATRRVDSRRKRDDFGAFCRGKVTASDEKVFKIISHGAFMF